MASNPFLTAAKIFSDAALKHRKILVGFSGGKESLCVLDLCVKSGAFETIVPYHLYFFRDLEPTRRAVAFAKERYNLTTILYPGKLIFEALKGNLYRPANRAMHEFAKLPKISSTHLRNLLSADTGIDLVATGHRKSDSLSRRRMFARMVEKSKNADIYPLRDWTKWDVFAYLKSNNIEIPITHGGATSGVGLYADAILWLHDAFPEDYERIRRVFPFVSGLVYRRAHYGVGKYFNAYGPLKIGAKDGEKQATA